jgi:hypothetical protein
MSALIGSDPLALQALEEGLIRGALEDAGAQGESQLDTRQRAAVIGEPVPIVFCRRVGDYGGVLISPAATEARFSNDASNAVTASYHLVLSEGRIGSIQVRDVFQRSCRVGSHSQTYDRRAGTWDPGNYVTAQAGYTMPECPYYCGSVGLYSGLSTMSFTVTVPNGVDQWNRQVHAFIRDGMEVPRLIEGTVGSSNNFADLYQWALVNCSRLPAAMIDTTSLTAAATFLSANGLTCDINIGDSSNLEDFAANLAPYFLLTQTRIAGRRGLRPLLPVNANGTINNGPIVWEFLFNEDYILPGSFELTYIPLADRKPFAVQAVWRQQLTDDFGIIRTSEVRYEFEAADGPYEQHDLSQFCTRENHAVKVAAYIRARRKWVTHTARWVSRAQAFNTLLVPGDICRVRLERNVAGMPPGAHDFLYQVDRITQTPEGDVQIEATHLPIDEQGRSLVALDVAGTTGAGILLTSNRSGVGCDVNSSGDTSVPAETFRVGSAIGGGRVLLAHDGVPTPPGTLPPGGALPNDSPADGPDETEDNPGDGNDSGEGGPLTRSATTCAIESPPCTNGIWTVTQIDGAGDPIPGTSLTYANSLPLNINITNKQVTFECLDGEGSNSPALKGPDNCSATDPIPPPNPASYYGWKAQFWCGGDVHEAGNINSKGPFFMGATSPTIALYTGYGVPSLMLPAGTGLWIVNKKIDSPVPFQGTTGAFGFAYWDTQSNTIIGYGVGLQTTTPSQRYASGFIYGHIYFYPTLADYSADNPQTRLTWFGNV